MTQESTQINLEQINYQVLNFEFPQLENLDLNQIINTLIQANEDYANTKEFYLAVLKHIDIVMDEPKPWLFPVHQKLAETVAAKCDWLNLNRRLTFFIFCGQLELRSGQVFPGFPLKLFVSNHIELTLHAHQQELLDHFRPLIAKEQLQQLNDEMQFQYQIHRGGYYHTMTQHDYLSFVNATKH